jgi:hypothetical protein
MRTACCFTAFVGVLLAFGVTSCTEESASPEAMGERLLRNLQPVNAGDTDTTYFEAILGGSICGVAELSLTPFVDQGRTLYDYRYLLTLRLTRATVFLRSIEATVDPKFSPIRIHDQKVTLGPQGPMETAWTKIEVGADKISVQEFQKGEETSKVLDAPERPFVTCTSYILQLAKLQEDSSFSLPLLRGGEGTVNRSLFRSSGGADGLTLVEVTDEEGKPAGTYRLDVDGRLESFQEPQAAWVMERTTKEKVLAFQGSWTSAMGAEVQPDSQVTPGAEP